MKKMGTEDKFDQVNRAISQINNAVDILRNVAYFDGERGNAMLNDVVEQIATLVGPIENGMNTLDGWSVLLECDWDEEDNK
jgi:hypothetical protein